VRTRPAATRSGPVSLAPAAVTWITNPWMGLAPYGSPLLVRDRSTRVLYALDWEAP